MHSLDEFSHCHTDCGWKFLKLGCLQAQRRDQRQQIREHDFAASFGRGRLPPASQNFSFRQFHQPGGNLRATDVDTNDAS